MLSADERIKWDIVKALCRDGRLDASKITVAVDRRAVLLGGSVPTYGNAMSAVEDALKVPDVARVRNAIAIHRPGSGPSPDDAAQQARIAAVLAADPDLAPEDIRVTSAEGVVTLTGTVDGRSKKFRAAKLVRREAGIAGFHNDLTVVPAGPAADRKIVEDITKALQDRQVVDERNIDIQVEKGAVNLTGLVSSPEVRRLINEIVFTTPGVTRVRDNMVIVQYAG
jgi:osmotically-inducible protein OsmY